MAITTPGESDRFRFEYPERDFPFYNGRPVGLSGGQWLVILIAVAAGFAALIALPIGTGFLPDFTRAVLFSAIPLGVLALFAGTHWKALFKPVGWRDVGWMIAFWLLNVAVSVVVGYTLMKTVGGTASNPVVAGMAQLSGSDVPRIMATTGVQLFGEEVFSVLPFLAFLWFFHQKLGLSRKGAIIAAWIGCAIWFGAAHLQTYQWNFIQAFAIIGTARIVLLLGYLKTKNLWVCFGSHLLTDWGYFFGIAVFGL